MPSALPDICAETEHAPSRGPHPHAPWPAALRAVRVGAHAFFLDVDGTLIDLAAHPDAVVVPDDLPRTLARLAEAASGALALVSGRTIERLDGLFGVARFAAAGGHGAQLRRAPGHGVEAVPDLDPEVAQALKRAALAFAGVFVEDKGPSLAIHYRACPAQAPHLRLALEEVAAAAPDLVLLPGHFVFEAKRAGYDKGSAVEALMRHPPFAGRTPVFIGDDVTDEAAFRAVLAAGGLAIAVGAPRAGAAAVLPDPSDVRRFLTHLAAQPHQRGR